MSNALENSTHFGLAAGDAIGYCGSSGTNLILASPRDPRMTGTCTRTMDSCWNTQDTNWRDLARGTLSEDPAIVEAHRLRWSLEAEERAIVEARLLARETDEEISQKSGISPLAMAYYKALFFNVRDRLDNRDWIIRTIHSMAGRRLLYGKETMGEQQRHTAYRLLGYFGRGLVVDAVVGTLSPRPRPGTPAESPAWLDNTLRTSIRSAAMMVVARFDRTNVQWLFRTQLQLLRREKRNQDSTAGVERNMEALLKSLRV